MSCSLVPQSLNTSLGDYRPRSSRLHSGKGLQRRMRRRPHGPLGEPAQLAGRTVVPAGSYPRPASYWPPLVAGLRLPRDHSVRFSYGAAFVAGSFQGFVCDFCPKLFQLRRCRLVRVPRGIIRCPRHLSRLLQVARIRKIVRRCGPPQPQLRNGVIWHLKKKETGR